MKTLTLDRPASAVRTVGFALFSMFFGAGNVIFPLFLGRSTGDQIGFAMTGMAITAILVPFLGVISMVLFDGNIKEYFGRMGRIPGLILMGLILALIGPFAGIPRCLALSHSTLALTFPNLSLGVFSFFACIVVFFLTLKKGRIISILGNILTPMLLLWLGAIIISGLFRDGSAAPIIDSSTRAFAVGLREGYNTLDLLAAFFFSSMVLSSASGGKRSLPTLLKASILAAVLLGAIYIGLGFIAAFHDHALSHIEPDQLLGALAQHLLGGWAGLFANMTVSLACLTTAITLSSIFADALSKEAFRGKIGYIPSLLLTLTVAYLVSYLKVTGIVRLIAPIVITAYPALITLALLNLAHKLKGLQTVKTPVWIVLGLTTALVLI